MLVGIISGDDRPAKTHSYHKELCCITLHTGVCGDASIVGRTITCTINSVDSEIGSTVRRNTTFEHEVITSTDIVTWGTRFFTNCRDHVIVHTSPTIHWRLETDYC